MTAFSAVTKTKRQWANPLNLLLVLALLLTATNPAWALGNNTGSLFGGQDNDFLPVDEALPFNFTTNT
ncbi:MAG: thiol:disulfide interchange protein, partial [Marinobacter sp.]|nr:thiol:disulfide interchange protein [Marinobacter sp.]